MKISYDDWLRIEPPKDSEPDLEPCPDCGGIPTIITTKEGYCVLCGICTYPTQPKTDSYTIIGEAIEAWNKQTRWKEK